MHGRDLTRLFDQPLAEEDRKRFLMEMQSEEYWAGKRAWGWHVQEVRPALQPRHNI